MRTNRSGTQAVESSRVVRSLKVERRRTPTPEEANRIENRKGPVYVRDCQESSSDDAGRRLALRSHVQRRGNRADRASGSQERLHQQPGHPNAKRGTEERYAPSDLYTSKERKGGNVFSALAIPSARRDVKQLCGDSASSSPIRYGLAVDRTAVPHKDKPPVMPCLEETGEASRHGGAISYEPQLKMG